MREEAQATQKDGEGGGIDLEYLQPARAQPEWWTSIPVEAVLVTAGSDELLLDGILAVGRRMWEAREGVEIVVVEGEAHEGPLLAKLAREREAGVGAEKIVEWVRGRL